MQILDLTFELYCKNVFIMYIINMSTRKTIQINPELFKISGQKTKKKKEKKEMSISPLVSPNNIKNKLLKRIKEHKQNEQSPKNKINFNPAMSISTTKPKQSVEESDNTYSDEFNSALNYLSDISKQKKVQGAKMRTLQNKTLKNMNASNLNRNAAVSLDLPIELQEPIITPQTNETFNVNYKIVDNVPYGCLKNGKKQTYREWKSINEIQNDSMIRPPTPPKKNESNNVFLSGATPIPTLETTPIGLTRAQKLEQIKNKLRMVQDDDPNTNATSKNISDFKKFRDNAILYPGADDLHDIMPLEDTSDSIAEIIEQSNTKVEAPKKILKRTIKRKFTLGKSDKLRKVSILIKDKQTRKNIIETQSNLKKTSISDVKKYLRQHGIIKAGSTCPNDILRKTFESVMLTGDVTNTNKDTLMHNLLYGNS